MVSRSISHNYYGLLDRTMELIWRYIQVYLTKYAEAIEPDCMELIYLNVVFMMSELYRMNEWTLAACSVSHKLILHRHEIYTKTVKEYHLWISQNAHMHDVGPIQSVAALKWRECIAMVHNYELFTLYGLTVVIWLNVEAALIPNDVLSCT